MIKAFLFDLDGVFYISDRILKGANETIDWLIKNKIPYHGHAIFRNCNNCEKKRQLW